METLNVLKAQEQAEACWKSFKERKLTKKNARENLLLNSDFNSLLLLLLDAEGNERAVKVVIDFLIKCIKYEIISPTALLTLIQQKLPGNNSCKIASIPVLNRISGLILEIEKGAEINFAFQLATNDLRLVPFLTERALSISEIDFGSEFINFLLGDPDLILTSSVFDDPHYKLARCRILSHLAGSIEIEEYSDLLATYLIWNSSRLCVMELGCLSQISQFYTGNHNLSSVHLELFEVYVEILCNEFFKFGIFGETIEFICKNCSKIISEYSAFKFGSLLMLRKSVDSSVAGSILQLLSHYEALGNFSKVCCAKVMMKSSFNEEFESAMKNIFKLSINCNNFDEESMSEPFTQLGMLTQLGFKCSRPQTSAYDDYFDLVYISKHFHDFSSVDFGKYLQKGHFETIFSLLAYKWNISNGEEVLKGFLKLLGHVEKEDSEVKILRYSWVVDFFESHFTDEMYLNYLPSICEFVTNTDNILFAFVQQKISTFLCIKENASVQLPSMFSLFILFESSQSRQSRLNYLTAMTLSYFHNIISRNLTEIDARAVFLGFKLIGKLAEIAVVDPRDIWSKYAEKFLSSNLFSSNSHIRGSIFSFVSSFRIIPEGKIMLNSSGFYNSYLVGPEGEMNDIKFSGIKLLLENLEIEDDPFALDQICESLARFEIENLRKVEIKLLQPEPTFDEEKNVKNVPIEDILSKSIIFNPLKLFDVSKRYNEPSCLYKKLWTKLIDNEVEIMPRTKFLGSVEKSSSVSEDKIKFISNPSFCNGLIFETFTENELSSVDDILKYLKSRLIPLVPSINSLLWYVRPHFPGFLLDAVDKIMKKVDDQRIKKQLTDHEYLLANLKFGTTPQSICTLIMVISSMIKSAFMNQNISENVLFSSWISVLTKNLADICEFKPLIGNEEFMGAFAMSCNILSGCSSNIDSVLCDALDSMILNNPKARDGVSVYSAIEAISKLKSERLEHIFLDKSTSSKRKLIAVLSAIRYGKLFSGKLILPDGLDDITLMLEIIATNGNGQYAKTTFSDPLEFKGIASYVYSIVSPTDLQEKSKQRAFDKGSVPAALKYDAILAYLLGSGMNLATLAFGNCKNQDFKAIEDSTNDPKCLALLQMISRSSINVKVESSNTGLERFDKFSWLKFICSIKSVIKYDILLECKLLPRIGWSPISINYFNFILKHVLSITPITKIPYINPSLLSCFLEHVLNVIKRYPIDLKRVIEVFYSNSDDKSSETLCEIPFFFIDENNCSSLRILIEEFVKYPQNLLKAYDTYRFNSLKPEILSELSSLLNLLAKNWSFDSTKLAIVNIDTDNVFRIIQNIFSAPGCYELNNLKFKVLSVKIGNLGGKEKIKAAIDIIDLMFIYQQDEEKFSILNILLYKIFEDLSSILLDSSIFLNDPEIVNKIRSRAAVIPKDIYDRLDSSFISFEYEKLAF